MDNIAAADVIKYLREAVADGFNQSIEREVSNRIDAAIRNERQNCAYIAAEAMHEGGVKDEKLFPLLQKHFSLSDDELADIQHTIVNIERPVAALKQYLIDNGKSASGATTFIRTNLVRSMLRYEPQLAKKKPAELLAEINNRIAARGR